MYQSTVLPLSLALSLFATSIAANPVKANRPEGGFLIVTIVTDTPIPSATSTTAPSPTSTAAYFPYCYGQVGLNLSTNDICRTGKHVFEGKTLGVHCVGNKIAVDGIDPYGVCGKLPTQDPNAEGGWTAGCRCEEDIVSSLGPDAEGFLVGGTGQGAVGES